MLYKGNHWTRCAGFMDASWVRLGITNDDLGTSWALPGDNLGMTWGWLGHYFGKTWQDSDILWHTLANSVILCHTLAYSCILWHTLAYSGILWHTLAYSGILLHTLAYSGILWHTLACSGIINASLITADGAYHCPVGSIWPFSFLHHTSWRSKPGGFSWNHPVSSATLSTKETLQKGQFWVIFLLSF